MGKIKFFSRDAMFNGDPLKSEIGNYYSVQIAEGTGVGRIDDNYALETEEYIDLRGFRVERAPTRSDKIDFIQVNPVNIRPVNSSIYTPNFIIPFRVYGDKDGKVFGDTDWFNFFTGGTFGDSTYKNLIDTEKVFYDTVFETSIFDKFRDIKTIEFYDTDPSSAELIPCSIVTNYLDYDSLVQNYQDWSTNLESELLMPNNNIISEYIYSLTYSDSEVRTKELQQAYSKNKATLINYHFPDDDYYNSLEKNQYFGEFFINYAAIVNLNDVIRHQENLFFDHHYFSEYLDDVSAISADDLVSSDLTIETQLSTFHNVNISFDREKNVSDAITAGEYDFKTLRSEDDPLLKNPSIGESIESFDLSSRFIELLKDIDEGNIPELQQKERPFMYDYGFSKPKYDTSEKYETAEQNFEVSPSEMGLKTINMLNMLAYAYNNPDVGLNDNFSFMGFNHPKQVATFLNDTLYRTLNAQNTSRLIDRLLDLMSSYFKDLVKVRDNAELLFEAGEAADGLSEIKDLSKDIIEKIYSSNYKITEVLAYKIEKIANSPTGDSSTPNVIQKFWVYNSTDAPDKISITDSQVKYGKKYTYKISAYVCVLSHKYKYGDFRLTKQIGTDDGLSTLIPGLPEEVDYCLEFYDPITKERRTQEFNTSTNEALLTAEEASTEQLNVTALSIYNRFATLEADISEHPQLADFNMYIEPCLELIEVPLLVKDVRVLDNPPNQINVVPFHFIDDSNRIGFKVGQDSFITKPYPTLISSADLNLKNEYLKSKELIPINNISKISESPARFIEMYRIKNKPNSFGDFDSASVSDGGLVARIDLRIPNDVYNYSDFIISDAVSVNTKYYYVLRLVNENGMYGPLSQIIECELVNDGGYVYALFDTIDSSDFNPDITTKTTTSFKKIMQLEPNLNQMIFDIQDVDFKDKAINQINNLKVGRSDNKLWSDDSAEGNKRFKIRLTSKKTSKKIDLNVRFNLRNKDNSKPSHNLPVFDTEPVPGSTIPQDPMLDESDSEEEAG